MKTASQQRAIDGLTDQVTRLEQQREVAHCVSLDLAASHTHLIGEHQEAEWIIRSLKADLRLRDAKIEKLSEELGSESPSINGDLWSADVEFAVSTN